jgi:hypothetical protein
MRKTCAVLRDCFGPLVSALAAFPKHWIDSPGIAPLLADRLSGEQRKAVGSILALVGLVTTIPAVWTVFGRCE